MTCQPAARAAARAFAVVAILATVSAGDASTKPKAAAPPKPACERAAYPGDPVCDLHEGNASEMKAMLPTPTSRKIRREDDASGMPLGKGVTIDGKTNFNENRFGAAPLEKLTPGPRKKDVNGGAQMDMRF